MRPLFLIAALLAPSLAAAENRPTVQERYLSFRSQSDRLAPEDFPAPLRPAAEYVIAVQLGCPQPCGDASSRATYASMLELAAERLALTPAQAAAARELYMPGGNPQLRSPLFAADRPGLTQQARDRMNAAGGRVSGMASALGSLQGPGDLPGTGPAGMGTLAGPNAGRRLTAAELAALNTQRGSQFSSALAFANPGSLPPPVTRATPRRERLSEEMGRESDRAFSDPKMRKAARCVLSNAERRVSRGGEEYITWPFGMFYNVTNDRGRIDSVAKDIMMDYRPCYGGAGAANCTPDSDNGFSELCGVKLSHAELADLDHYFFARHAGVIPVVGPAACLGGVLFWDGAKPLVCNWFTNRSACASSVAYNWKQVATGGRGCVQGVSTTMAATGLARGDR